MTGLSPRQRDVLQMMLRFCVAFGRSPTIREIAAELGIGSPNCVREHLQALVRKGYVGHEGACLPGGYWPTLDADGARIEWRMNYQRVA